VKVNRRTYALHAVWDYVLLERLHLPVDSLTAMLARELAADPAGTARNAQGTPARWALETHALAPACYLLHGKPLPEGKIVQLDRDYVRAGTLTSLAQLKRAGTRLAFVLNRALDPGSGLPALRAPPGGAPKADAYFGQAEPLREDAGSEAAGPAAPNAPAKPARARSARGKHALARYAWSENSKVYHYSECADVKRIHKKNLVTSDIPPPDKTLHANCPLP
jgi:hypothetical protein